MAEATRAERREAIAAVLIVMIEFGRVGVRVRVVYLTMNKEIIEVDEKRAYGGGWGFFLYLIVTRSGHIAVRTKWYDLALPGRSRCDPVTIAHRPISSTERYCLFL